MRGILSRVGMSVGAAVLVSTAFTLPSSASGNQGVVVEASVIALSGPNSFEGLNQEAGLFPAIYDINHNGGLLGKKLVWKGVDTRSDPADALPAVQQLLSTVPNLIGVTGPGTTSAPTIVPVLNSADMTMFAVAGESSYNLNKDPYFWRLFPPDAANGVAMVLWAKERGYTKIATVFGTDSGSQGDLPGVLLGAKALHMKIVASINLTPDQPLYSADVERMKQANPQVIMTESDGPTGATFYGELKQQRGLVPIFGTEPTVNSTWISPVSGAIGNSDFLKYYTGVVTAVSKPSPALTQFQKDITTVRSIVPKPLSAYSTNPFARTYYDGMIIQALAIEASHSLKPAVFNKFIVSVSNPGRGKTVVYTFAAGLAALKAHKSIEYVGATGLIQFNAFHNSYGNEEAVRIPSVGPPRSLGIITAAQIQSVH